VEISVEGGESVPQVHGELDRGCTEQMDAGGANVEHRVSNPARGHSGHGGNVVR